MSDTERASHPKLSFTHNLFTNIVSVKLSGGAATELVFDSRSVLFTLGFGRTGKDVSNESPVLAATFTPENLYTRPMNTRISRIQEDAFGKMELSSRKGDLVFVCMSGHQSLYPLVAERDASNLLPLSNAIGCAALGMPGFPIRCVRGERFRVSNDAKIFEFSLRYASGQLVEGVDRCDLLFSKYENAKFN